MGSVSFWSLDDEHSLVEEEYRTMFCDNEGFWTELFEQWDKLDQLPFSVRHSGSSSDTIFDGVKNSGNSPASCNVGNSALPTSSAPTPPRVLNASLLRQLLPKRAQKPKLNDNHLGKCPCPLPLQSTPHGKAPSPAPPALMPTSLIQEPLKLSSLGKTIESDDHYEEAALSLPRGNATADDCGGGTNRMVTRKRMFACLDDGGARGANRMMAFKQSSESLGAGGGRGTHELMTSVRSSSKEKVECETVRRLKITSLFCTLRAILPFDIPQNDRYILVDTTCHYIAFLQQQLERLKAKTHILKYVIMEQEKRGSKLRPNAESEFESQTAPKAASKSQLELSSDLAPYVTVFVSEGRMLYITVSCYEESPGLFATILDTLEQRGLDIHSANRSQHEHGEVTVVYAFHATVQKSSLCFRDIEELKTDLFAKAASKL